MDSLTQIVLGASVGEAVLGKKIGNKAMLWGAIAGTIPDLDVFLKFFTDDITSTVMHRGFSHSLVFSVLFSFILGWAVFKNGKLTLSILAFLVLGLSAVITPILGLKIGLPLLIIGIVWFIYTRKSQLKADQKDWTWLFFWALVTHPLLDANTTWGTQFFWPFEYRLAYKNIFVVDPLYTIPFLILVIVAMCYKRTNPKRSKFNKWALIISTSYMALTFVFKTIGYYKFEQELKSRGISYTEMDTKPTPLNSILWNAQVETETGYLNGYYSLFDSKEITFLKEIPKNHHLLDPYREQKVVKQLMKISVGWYYLEENEEGLLYTDIRFGQLGFDDDAPYLWKYQLTVDAQGLLQAKRIHFEPNGSIMYKALNDFFERLKGN